MKYIYIDESGDLGDSYSSSKYFVIVAVIVDDPKNLAKIIKKTKKKNIKSIHNYPELKGSKTDKYLIKKVLRKINNIDYEAYSIFIDKKNLQKVPNFYNHHILYDELASELAQKIKITSPTCIIVDKSKFKLEHIYNFNNLFSSKLDNADNHPVSIIHGDSINYKGLQIADIIAWSIFKSLEQNNSKYLDLIQNKKIFEVYKN